MASNYNKAELTGVGRWVNEFEETAIALILGAMLVITFINVVLRFAFNSGLIWGLDAVANLFAWLVIFGASYAIKTTSHLGVDAVTNLFSPPIRRVLALIAGALCVLFAVLLMKGAWDAWANFANLPQTTGRWFPTGFEEMRRSSFRGYLTDNGIPMVEWLRWLEPLINYDESYEKFPMVVLRFILPFGVALILFRFIQAFVRVWTGVSTSLIVSHEAEDDVENVRHVNAGD
ncbi:C4-dicarboxylate TRAP transporter small permease protein DctQ [Ascidiaceihabitans donghaensis]|uniref:TRAP transporter small permease protein n=1 Tax=Ascidiaceihabitans donghaensis TaxID=1510460 RepID=A0A2R8BDF5_9RHOB|nr:TRAP transporter small permease [Ascidiaceihabitans donghaensis]SPH20969.1 C4-dicarboxylate TRAP transporter small permease protein DctQ [Ascidiaceihabitans donghaensis]